MVSWRWAPSRGRVVRLRSLVRWWSASMVLMRSTTLVVSTTILLVVSMVSVVPVVWHGRGVARSVVVHCGD